MSKILKSSIREWFEGETYPSEEEAENIKVVNMEYENSKGKVVKDEFLMIADRGY